MFNVTDENFSNATSGGSLYWSTPSRRKVLGIDIGGLVTSFFSCRESLTKAMFNHRGQAIHLNDEKTHFILMVKIHKDHSEKFMDAAVKLVNDYLAYIGVLEQVYAEKTTNPYLHIFMIPVGVCAAAPVTSSISLLIRTTYAKIFVGRPPVTWEEYEKIDVSTQPKSTTTLTLHMGLLKPDDLTLLTHELGSMVILLCKAKLFKEYGFDPDFFAEMHKAATKPEMQFSNFGWLNAYACGIVRVPLTVFPLAFWGKKNYTIDDLNLIINGK